MDSGNPSHRFEAGRHRYPLLVSSSSGTDPENARAFLMEHRRQLWHRWNADFFFQGKPFSPNTRYTPGLAEFTPPPTPHDHSTPRQARRELAKGYPHGVAPTADTAARDGS